MSVTVARVELHRQNDPRNERRILEVIQTGWSYQMWEKVRFGDTRRDWRDAQTKSGTAEHMRRALKDEMERLCTEEEFVLVHNYAESFLDG